MKFFRALRVDLRRSLIQKKTLLLLALLLGYMCFNASQYLFGTQAGAGAPLILQQALHSITALDGLYLAIVPALYAASFLQDTQSGFAKEAAARVGVGNLLLSRGVAAALSAFLLGALAAGVFSLGMAAAGFSQTVLGPGMGTYLDLVWEGRLAGYYAVQLTVFGLDCAMAASAALLVSTWIPNSYVTILSPVVLYYFLRFFLRMMIGLLPDDPIFGFLYLENYMSGEFFREDHLLSAVVSCTGLLTVTALCLWGFLRRGRRRLGV